MTMGPRLRKAVLTAHVTTSIGWLGAVVVYLVLDVAAVYSDDVGTVRAAYLAMELTIWYAIVPLAVAAVVIGVVNALGTPWGLFRHYWVGQIPAGNFCNHHSHAGGASCERFGGHSSFHRRSPRVAWNTAPLRWRAFHPAGYRGSGGVQAEGHDPIWLAQAACWGRHTVLNRCSHPALNCQSTGRLNVRPP